MRFKKPIIVSLLISSFSLAGCHLDNANSEWYASSIKGIKLFDYWVDGEGCFDKAKDGVSLSEYPDVTFKYDKSTSELKANEEVIHYGMFSLYAADFNNDGYRELCIGFSVGSGIIDERIDIYDYHNGKNIFQLNHRVGYPDQANDYYLFLDDLDQLCVKETLNMKPDEETRTGRFTVDTDGVISVSWKNHPNNGGSNASSSDNHNSSSDSSSSIGYPGEIKTIARDINVDYGLHEQGKATLLFGDMIIPFDYKVYNIDYLAAGDYVEVSYKGEWLIRETYPATLALDGEIVDVKVTHGRIFEFEVAENPGGGKSLRILDSSITPGNHLTTNCINRDGTFDYLTNYPVGTRIYGINPASYNSRNIIAFYSYNPSERKESIDLKDYSFNDIAGIETSNIIDFKVSESIYTSFAWQYQYDDYSFLNTKYEKIDFSIKAEIFDKKPSDGGDAITIHLMTDILLETYPTQNYSFNMYISYADYHLYYGSTIEGATNAYRSKNRISEKYISLLKDQRNRDGAYLLRVSGNSNASPDLPKTGHYAPGHKFSFKVEHVTDLTFYAYLNKELLTPVKDDGTLGGYSFYEFEMPSQDSALVITSDEFYVYRPYSFAEVFSWVNAITKDTLKGVRIEDGYIGVNPETANPTIKYSEDERDIDYNLMVLETEPLIKAENQYLDGGAYRLVTYILNNGAEYEIEINNGHVIYRDFNSYQEFRFDSTPTRMPDVFYPENN